MADGISHDSAAICHGIERSWPVDWIFALLGDVGLVCQFQGVGVVQSRVEQDGLGLNGSVKGDDPGFLLETLRTYLLSWRRGNVIGREEAGGKPGRHSVS